MKKIIIAIDGFSACGKSTLAKQLAQVLGYIFVDSGAMYRAITFFCLENNIDINDAKALADTLSNIQLTFEWNKEKSLSEICLNGKNIANAIRTMDVANSVSKVATVAAVRRFAVEQQQLMGRDKGIVMDGRDIGTVVFPDAELKIFVTASIEVRTQRRYNELLLQNAQQDFEEVRDNLLQRDYTDSTRTESPLRQATDAILLDNSDMTREQQLTKVLEWVKEKILE